MTIPKEAAMPVYIDKEKRLGKDVSRLIVDKSDKHHPNRIIGIIREVSLLDGEFEYTFHVPGMKFMPTIKIDKAEFEEFVRLAKGFTV